MLRDLPSTVERLVTSDELAMRPPQPLAAAFFDETIAYLAVVGDPDVAPEFLAAQDRARHDRIFTLLSEDARAVVLAEQMVLVVARITFDASPATCWITDRLRGTALVLTEALIPGS